MTKQTSQPKQRVQAVPVKSQTSSELPEGVVQDDEGVYVEEVSGKPLSDDPSYVPEPVEKEDGVFDTAASTKPEEGKGALNTKIKARLEELEGLGKSVVYPTNEGAWDQALLDRLNKA